MNSKIDFHQEIVVINNKDFIGKKGVVLGIAEEDGVVYGYSVLVFGYDFLISFGKNDIVPTGKVYTREQIENFSTNFDRIENLGLPVKGEIRYVPPKLYAPVYPLPTGAYRGYIDRFGNEWVHTFRDDAIIWKILLSVSGIRKYGNSNSGCKYITVSQSGDIVGE